MKLKSIIRPLILCLSFTLFLSSCMVTRTTVGDGPVGKRGHATVYSNAKQLYLFWGLVPLGRTQPAMPPHRNIQIKTSTNIVDLLITGVTGGLFSTQTVKVLVKKGSNNNMNLMSH